MTNNEAMTLLDKAWAEYMAQQDAIKAKGEARKAAHLEYVAQREEFMRTLHWCGHPQWTLGALCPADAYAEDERLGRNTD